MTSGNLLRLGALEAVGRFDDELFIDQVDNDLCFRLRLSGWRILQARRAVLEHRQGTLRRTALGFYSMDYPALRRYYLARNTLVTMQRYGTASGRRSLPRRPWASRTDWRRCA